MANDVKSEKKKEKKESNEAYAIRKHGKLLRVLLNKLCDFMGPDIVKEVELDAGIDLDGDGKIGSARIKFILSVLAASMMIGLATFAATTDWRPFDASTYGNMKVQGNDSTKQTTVICDNLTVSNSTSLSGLSMSGGTLTGVTNVGATVEGDAAVSGSLTVGTNLTVTGTINGRGAVLATGSNDLQIHQTLVTLTAGGTSTVQSISSPFLNTNLMTFAVVPLEDDLGTNFYMSTYTTNTFILGGSGGKQYSVTILGIK